MLEQLRSPFLDAPIGDGALVRLATGWIGVIWYTIVLAVCTLGYFQMYGLLLNYLVEANFFFFLADGAVSCGGHDDPLLRPPTPPMSQPFAPSRASSHTSTTASLLPSDKTTHPTS